MNLLQNIREKLSLKKIQESLIPEKTEKGKELQFKIGATSGLYGIARSEELADVIMKLSYTLTQGAACVELASDVPHEVNYTQGKELRYIAERQGIDISLHGSLTIPIGYPDTIEWNSAQEHMQKSVKSAVHAGAKYVDFHSCLHQWLELFTYAGSRLHIVMSASDGRFIAEIFPENPELANWFVNETKYRFREMFFGNITGEKGTLQFKKRMEEFVNKLFEENSEEIEKAIKKEFIDMGLSEVEANARAIASMDRLRFSSIDVKVDNLTRHVINTDEYNKKYRNTQIKVMKELIKEYLIEHGDWYDKERTYATLEMAFYIIAHDMYIKSSSEDKKDPMWEDMVELYRKELDELNYRAYDKNLEKVEDSSEDEEFESIENSEKKRNWLENTLKTIEKNPDKELIRTFKEFYYGVVTAKFLQGNLIKLVHWMENDLSKIIDDEVKKTEPDSKKIEEQKKKLQKVIDELCIAIENPDARDPSEGGRFLLWRPKQIYLAVKNIRGALKKDNKKHADKIVMIVDFEHLATQGVDPLKELTEMKDNPLTKDFAKLVKVVHSGVPTPLHSHKPISAEDREIVYRLLWILKEAGLGSEILTYLIFERGGFQKPYAGSVRALRLFSKLMKENVPPDKVPEAFYVVPKPQDIARQKVIIFEHAFEPIKGTLKVPEEDYTLLGTGALKTGKRPEDWKKEELK